MRILLARIAPLYGRNGGMERVEARMADAMVQRGHAVGILSMDELPGKPCFSIHSDVQMLNLYDYMDHSFHDVHYKLVRKIVRPFSKRSALRWRNKGRAAAYKSGMGKVLAAFQPDVIVSFDAESSAMFFDSVPDLNIPLITMFHFPTDIAVNWEDSDEQKALLRSSCVQVLMDQDIQTLKKRLPHVTAVRIPNVVPQWSPIADLNQDKSVYTIINVARLEKNQKRQYLLVEAFALLADKFLNWNVEFWGSEPDGGTEYTAELQKLIHDRKLESRVFLKGNSSDIHSHYVASDIFAFPSAFEGFPLAMTEAMSAGLPVVAYKDCPAVNELIENGKDGYLAENGVKPFAEGLQKLMKDRELRSRMGQQAHNAMKQYAPESIWNQWENLLRNVVHLNHTRGN
ncbi:glycosyltransferase [Dialister succinatiphilus]|uniref:glycosyltransferase n=1 Tax=Dialister succinatiphilus TaxID=487173 RepID=UPI0040281BAC